MPIHSPFIFTHEDHLQEELSKLDQHQTRVLPVFQHYLQQQNMGVQINSILTQNFSQALIQLPFNTIKAISGQIHQDSLIKNVLVDSLHLTAQHQLDLTKQNVESVALLQVFPKIGQYIHIIPDLFKDSAAILNSVVVNPVINKLFSVGIAQLVDVQQEITEFLQKAGESYKIFKEKDALVSRR